MKSPASPLATLSSKSSKATLVTRASLAAKHTIGHSGATTADNIKQHKRYQNGTAAEHISHNKPKRAPTQPEPPTASNYYQFQGVVARYQKWADVGTYRAHIASDNRSLRTASTNDDPVFFLQGGPTGISARRLSSSCVMSERSTASSRDDDVSFVDALTGTESSAASFTSEFKKKAPPAKKTRDYVPLGFRDPHRYDDLETPPQVILARAAYNPATMYLPAPPEPCPICVPSIAVPPLNRQDSLLDYQRKYNNFDPEDPFCKQFSGGLEGLKRRNKYSTVSWCTLLNLPRDAGCRDIWSHPRDAVLDVLIQPTSTHATNHSALARMASATNAAIANGSRDGLNYECSRGHTIQAMRSAAAGRTTAKVHHGTQATSKARRATASIRSGNSTYSNYVATQRYLADETGSMVRMHTTHPRRIKISCPDSESSYWSDSSYTSRSTYTTTTFSSSSGSSRSCGSSRSSRSSSYSSGSSGYTTSSSGLDSRTMSRSNSAYSANHRRY